jgi:hypothetical protein
LNWWPQSSVFRKENKQALDPLKNTQNIVAIIEVPFQEDHQSLDDQS